MAATAELRAVEVKAVVSMAEVRAVAVAVAVAAMAEVRAVGVKAVVAMAEVRAVAEVRVATMAEVRVATMAEVRAVGVKAVAAMVEVRVEVGEAAVPRAAAESKGGG